MSVFEIEETKEPQAKRQKLPVNITHPHLVSEWDDARPMEDYTHGCHTKIKWKCENNHRWEAELKSRCHATKPTKCTECRRAIVKEPVAPPDKEAIEQYRKRIITRNHTRTGDDTERWVVEFLQSAGLYSKVEKIGQNADKTDIIVTFNDGTIKSIQTRSLVTISEERDIYSVKNDTEYLNDMLMIYVNQARTRFAATYYGMLNRIKCLKLRFKSNKSKYKGMMYTDKSVFLEKINDLIKDSCDYEANITSAAINQELAMLARLEVWCKEHNLRYRRNDTASNSIKGWIEERPFQARCSSLPMNGDSTYRIHFQKSLGYLQNKRIYQNYAADDGFDLFIIEVGGTLDNPTQYCGQFLILPTSVLLSRGIMRTEQSKGKPSIYTHNPNFKGKHWTTPYWNNISMITSISLKQSVSFSL